MNQEELKVTCLASSSSGNAFLLDIEGTTLLIECGLPFKDLQKRIVQAGRSLSEVNCCIITHAHSDHSKCAQDLANHLINVYATRETIDLCNLYGKSILPLPILQWQWVSSLLRVLAVPVDHDIPGAVGFVIKSKNHEVFFINDCYKIDYDLSIFKPDLVMVECNFDDQPAHIEYNQYKANGDRCMMASFSRLFKAHMGLYGCKKLLSTFDLSRCNAIVLMHLSDRNSNEFKFKQIIGEHTGKKVLVAGKYGGIK